ncbi:MAG: hypothetical protein MSG78_04000 [Clostridiales bacterium]|nr:hypothetical protein [Clostridiales bacterium]
MKIRFFASTKKYGKSAIAMPDVTLNIETANQLVECIRDGYIPIISWADTKCYLYEMMYNVIDNSFKYTYSQCTGIIDAIGNYYFSKADFFESDAIMVFHRFLQSGVLNFQEV